MKPRILIIDDEDDIREVARIALEETAGWQVLEASSGAEGIALTLRERPDVVLLDLMMPDLDGLAVMAQLKADERTAATPVILLTAKVQAVRQHPPGEAAGVILKPFDPLQLAAELAAVLEWPAPSRP
jgi:CheY-like chemotaxis protein